MSSNNSPGASAGEWSAPVDTTLALVDRAKRGDAQALEVLFARCLPALKRWARGRLPPQARDLVETADLVQEAAISTLRNLHSFEVRHPGALHAYLREAVANRISDYVRRAKRRPVSVSLQEGQPDDAASPLDEAIGQEQMARYEAALSRLSDLDRAAIVARLEMQLNYAEVAEALGKPSANAARSAVVRAVEKLIREMGNEA